MKLYFWYSKLMDIGAKLCVFALLVLMSIALMQVAFAIAGFWAAIAAGAVLSLVCAWTYEKIAKWMAS
jgi:uncharacterized membrane protein YvlD (DUF360 family)